MIFLRPSPVILLATCHQAHADNIPISRLTFSAQRPRQTPSRLIRLSTPRDTMAGPLAVGMDSQSVYGDSDSGRTYCRHSHGYCCSKKRCPRYRNLACDRDNRQNQYPYNHGYILMLTGYPPIKKTAYSLAKELRQARRIPRDCHYSGTVASMSGTHKTIHGFDSGPRSQSYCYQEYFSKLLLKTLDCIRSLNLT